MSLQKTCVIYISEKNLHLKRIKDSYHPNKKWVNRCFTTEDVWMESKHVRRCSTWLATGEMQMTTTTRPLHTHKNGYRQRGKHDPQRDPPSRAWLMGIQIDTDTVEGNSAVPYKSHIDLPSDPAISVLDICSREMKIDVHTKACT